jgi:hypothetical protein
MSSEIRCRSGREGQLELLPWEGLVLHVNLPAYAIGIPITRAQSASQRATGSKSQNKHSHPATLDLASTVDGPTAGSADIRACSPWSVPTLMAGFLPYSQARAALAAQRPRQRPWSPPIVDPRSTAAGRDIETFLAHASHGWAVEQVDTQHAAAEAEDDLFSRHRTHFRERREPSSDHNYGYEYTYNRAQNQRREASDVSVEALDLADYAVTLKRQGPDWDPYPSYDYPTSTARRPFSRETPPTTSAATFSSGRRRREAELSPPRNPPPSSYPHNRIFSPTHAPPPSAVPPLDRPFSALSRDTTRPPPSLISAGATSHSSHAESSYPPAPSSLQ